VLSLERGDSTVAGSASVSSSHEPNAALAQQGNRHGPTPAEGGFAASGGGPVISTLYLCLPLVHSSRGDECGTQLPRLAFLAVLTFSPLALRELALRRTLFKALVPLVNVVPRAFVLLCVKLLVFRKLLMTAARHTPLISSNATPSIVLNSRIEAVIFQANSSVSWAR
jgi:hypothetical protein